MRISSSRLILIVTTAVSLLAHPKPASATTVNVTVGPSGNLVFSPSSVTIHPGDTVHWIWGSDFHSSTSGSPGMPTGLWDSTLLKHGHTITHPIDTVSILPYQATYHTACGGIVNNTIVVADTEMYTLAPETTSMLGNISTRSFVQTADNVMIGGFIVQGTGPKRVIIRAIGPELTRFGVPNVLANPTLELHNGAGAVIASNDNWQTTMIGSIITQNQVQEILNSGRAPTDPRESAIIANLPAGNYTAIVNGVNNTTGVALVEVYDLQQDSFPLHRHV